MGKRHVLTDQEIASAINLFFPGIGADLIEPLSLGVENSNYKIRVDSTSYVLRVYGSEHGYMGVRTTSDLGYEFEFMHRMRKEGLPIPNVHQTPSGADYTVLPTSNGDRFVSVIEFLEGEAPTHFSPEMVAQIASAMAKMHVVSQSFELKQQRNWPGTVIEMTSDRLARYKNHPNRVNSVQTDRLDTIVIMYEKRLKETDVAAIPSGPIHGDIIYHNTVFKNGKLNGIFDFDDCRHSQFLEGIVKSLMFFFDDPTICLIGEGTENFTSFMDAYQKIRPIDDDELNALPLFMQSRVLYQLCRAFNDQWDGKKTQKVDIEKYLNRVDSFSDLLKL